MVLHFIADILILLSTSVVFLLVARRLGQPAVLGYLAVGIVVGPGGLGWLENNEAMHVLGEVGVAFLLFAIALEFSIPQFVAMRGILLGLGGAQVLVGTVTGAIIAGMIGMPLGTAVVVGGALAMSSTAIVMKQLTDQAELQERHGRLALGILLLQDLAAVPFLVVIPILASGQHEALGSALGLALLKAVFALACVLAIGRYALRPLFHEVARASSLELFTLTVLLVSLLAASGTALLGLSLALGAFIAGLMLSETEYRHQIDLEIRPFRDVLMGLFFVTVGMHLEPAALLDIWPWVLLLVVGLVVGKGVAIAGLAWLWGRDREVALRTGLVLAHGGEFGFALLALALSSGLLSTPDSQPILVAIVVSMLTAPILIRHNGRLTRSVIRSPRPSPMRTDELAEMLAGRRDHVILCGFGRVGGQMAALLKSRGIDFVALDLDPRHLRDAWETGSMVFYGDATRVETLRAAGVERARAVVVTFEQEGHALQVVQAVREERPALPILVRTRDDSSVARLASAGANEIVPETVETGLMLTIHLMMALDVPDDEIEQCIRDLRRDQYLPLRRV